MDFFPVTTEVNGPIVRPYEPSRLYGRVSLEACGKSVLRSPVCPLRWGDSRVASVTDSSGVCLSSLVEEGSAESFYLVSSMSPAGHLLRPQVLGRDGVGKGVA